MRLNFLNLKGNFTSVILHHILLVISLNKVIEMRCLKLARIVLFKESTSLNTEMQVRVVSFISFWIHEVTVYEARLIDASLFRVYIKIYVVASRIFIFV